MEAKQMRTIRVGLLFISAAALSACVHGTAIKSDDAQAKSISLVGDKPIEVPGKLGHFDFMNTDAENDRILAAHSGGGNLVLVDLKTGQLMNSIEVGDVQGVAIDAQSGVYILGDADEHKVVFVSAKTLKKLGEVKVSGPVDAVAFNPKKGFAYAGEDDGNRVWVIDVKKHKLVTTIPISGIPEFISYDPKTNRLYQNIKNKDSVAVIDPETNKVEAEWSTAPATGPHGLAINSNSGHLFIAGHNGKLIEIEIGTGKVISQVDIAPGTDQIAFDSSTKTIYCASKGFISAVKETDSGLKALENIPVTKGAHTLSVDPTRHDVWVSYADKSHSYLQKFNTSSETAEKE